MYWGYNIASVKSNGWRQHCAHNYCRSTDVNKKYQHLFNQPAICSSFVLCILSTTMNISCSICAELFTNADGSNISVTPCGHAFHTPCLLQWLERLGSKYKYGNEICTNLLLLCICSALFSQIEDLSRMQT